MGSAAVVLFIFSLYYNFYSADGECKDISTDCQYIAHKCATTDLLELQVLNFSCPLTCGYCNQGVAQVMLQHRPSYCEDESPDCAKRKKYCRKLQYRRMMTIQCAKTCNFCYRRPIAESDEEDTEEDYQETRHVVPDRRHSIIRSRLSPEILDELEERGILSELIGAIRGSDTDTTTTTTEACLDRAYDCNSKKALCNHKSYITLVTKLCRKTCGICD